jgi:hypothetical protein
MTANLTFEWDWPEAASPSILRWVFSINKII